MARTVKQLFDMTGKTALVTGGSRGLGLQLARALGEAGARIMISSRKEADLQTAAAELKSAGIDVQWIAADCANEKDIHRLAAETLKAFGHVDVLVNNAGVAWGLTCRRPSAGSLGQNHEPECARLFHSQPIFG